MSPASSSTPPAPRIGLIGFGAFGRLIARHLAPHARLVAHDPASGDPFPDVPRVDLATAARCPIVVLATPVAVLPAVVAALRPHLRPGALVVDVGSVKTGPARIMRDGLPAHVDILATHPLFGPGSAGEGLRGLKLVVCPIRGRGGHRAAAFLRRGLGLTVIRATPEAHDRAMAAVQGLTHLIATALAAMDPPPKRMTTRSFDLIMQAVGMVRHDAPEVRDAIHRANPYAAEIRQRFLALAAGIDGAPAERPHPPS